MYEKIIQMSSFESNLRHLDTYMRFKILLNSFSNFPWDTL